MVLVTAFALLALFSIVADVMSAEDTREDRDPGTIPFSGHGSLAARRTQSLTHAAPRLRPGRACAGRRATAARHGRGRAETGRSGPEVHVPPAAGPDAGWTGLGAP
jgi:hypothetical protein